MSEKPTSRSAGRPRSVTNKTGTRINMYMSDEVLKSIKRVQKRYREELNIPVSMSFILREGAKKQVRDMSQQLNKSLKGEFHARKR